MLCEPGHRQQPAPTRTRMSKGRSSLCGFGLGFQLRWADLATNFDCWFSMNAQLFILMLHSRIQALLCSVSIRRPDQIENAFVVLVWLSEATAATDSDSDYCFFDRPLGHYWKPSDSTAPCLSWSCLVFDVCHHVHKIGLYFLRRNLTYRALVLALLLICWLLLTYSCRSATTFASKICGQRWLLRRPWLANWRNPLSVLVPKFRYRTSAWCASPCFYQRQTSPTCQIAASSCSYHTLDWLDLPNSTRHAPYDFQDYFEICQMLLDLACFGRFLDF